MNHGLHSEAGNGKRDGLKSSVDWAISSQAIDGTAKGGSSVEGSTTRTMSANDNWSHECPARDERGDIVYSAAKAVGPDKEPAGSPEIPSEFKVLRATCGDAVSLSEREAMVSPRADTGPGVGPRTRLFGGEAGAAYARILEQCTEAPGGCLVWTKSVSGRPQVGGSIGGKQWMAKVHKLLWERENGPVPKDKRLFVVCGNVRCVRPEHHRLGTTKDLVVAAHAGQRRPTRATDEERFKRFIRVSRSGCWLWTGAVQGAGSYGFFWLDRKLVGAHRASFRMFKDAKLSEYDIVEHVCDDRRCVNPEHLRLGTPRSNMEDRSAKGRLRRADTVGVAVAEKVRLELRDEVERIANKYCIEAAEVVRTLMEPAEEE